MVAGVLPGILQVPQPELALVDTHIAKSPPKEPWTEVTALNVSHVDNRDYCSAQYSPSIAALDNGLSEGRPYAGSSSPASQVPMAPGSRSSWGSTSISIWPSTQSSSTSPASSLTPRARTPSHSSSQPPRRAIPASLQKFNCSRCRQSFSTSYQLRHVCPCNRRRTQRLQTKKGLKLTGLGHINAYPSILLRTCVSSATEALLMQKDYDGIRRLPNRVGPRRPMHSYAYVARPLAGKTAWRGTFATLERDMDQDEIVQSLQMHNHWEVMSAP